MQKVDYRYHGLSRFLYHLKAKEMEGVEFFTTGASAQDPELTNFKENLHPIARKPIYVLELGDKTN